MHKKLDISRRDFMNGIALSIAAGTALSPAELFAMQGASGEQYYPPGLSGLRGNHVGSFETGHALSWGGASWARPSSQTDDDYDLVVVGGGLSGLSAAFLYRQRVGPDARVLIIDNHDDFGGHAKRNEFDVDGTKLIGYGGSQSIDTPGHYSKVAKQLLKDVSIDTEKFYDYFDRDYFSDRNLGRGIYFSEEKYGADSVHKSFLRFSGITDLEDIADMINKYPLSDESKKGLLNLLNSDEDYLPGKSRDEKIDLLRSTSYSDFLEKYAGVNAEIVTLFRDVPKGFWGVGWDALSTLEAYRLGAPGTAHLGIGELENDPPGRDEPYIFHFPDGNAGVARSLVRQLIPEAVPGSTMEDLVVSRVDYSILDRNSAAMNIRLNSTAVDVRTTKDDRHVDVTYVRDGKPYRVRGKHAVLACNNNIIPHLCPGMPAKQKEAIAYASKVPLVYINVAIRNSRAFENLGLQSIYIPQGILMHSFGMDFPVSMGGYEFAQNADSPTVIHGTYVPSVPDEGLNAREQHTAGRRKLYELTFEEFERDIVRQMSGALEGGGFDAQRDIAAITVNRWPHGYAYEYNDYSDPADWNRYKGPHLAGAAQMGRISIANSDAAGYAYVNGAIDAADRAVDEQITL